MSMIRNYTVDLLKYLPEFLAKSPEMAALMNVESKEHDIQEAALQDIFKQFFISSATWGLSAWERNLEITPDAEDTYQQRRNRIYLKLQGRQTSTKEFMRKLAARYFSEDAILEPIEDNPNETFWIIDHGGKLLYAQDLFEAIDTYIPAHLLFGLHVEREIHMEAEDAIRIGVASAISGAKKFGIRHPPDSNLPYGVKVFSGKSGIVRIGAEANILRATGKETIGIVAGEYRRKIIKANSEDLPESMRNILESSRAAPRIGISLYATRKSNMPIDRPKTAETLFPVGFFIAETGRREIRADTPKGGINLQCVGSLVAICKNVRILADMSDLRPSEGDMPKLELRVGTKMLAGGVKKLALSMPGDAQNAMRVKVITVKTGRTVISANLDDMSQARMRTNAVGRMHVGLAHLGI